MKFPDWNKKTEIVHKYYSNIPTETFTIEKDGYLNINAGCRWGSLRIHINGTEVAVGNQANDAYDCDYSFIPCKAGDRLTFSGGKLSSYSGFLWIYYIPFK